MTKKKPQSTDRRLKVPDVIHNSNLELVRATDIKGDELALEKIYGVKSMFEAKEDLMYDIIQEAWSDPLLAPNNLKVQSACIKEFIRITGAVWVTANKYYKKIEARVNKVENIGILRNYAATVKVDILEKMYGELDPNSEHYKQLLERDPKKKPLTDFVRIQLYQQMLNVADSLTDMGIRQDSNAINLDKNRILEKKVDSDNKVNDKIVELNFKGATRQEKERLAVEALLSDKGVLNPYLSAIDVDCKEVRDDDQDE